MSEVDSLEARVLALWQPGTAVLWRHGDAEPPRTAAGWFSADELGEVAERLVARHPERVYDADEREYVEGQRLECEVRGARFVAARHQDHAGRLLSIEIDDL